MSPLESPRRDGCNILFIIQLICHRWKALVETALTSTAVSIRTSPPAHEDPESKKTKLIFFCVGRAFWTCPWFVLLSPFGRRCPQRMATLAEVPERAEVTRATVSIARAHAQARTRALTPTPAFATKRFAFLTYYFIIT